MGIPLYGKYRDFGPTKHHSTLQTQSESVKGDVFTPFMWSSFSAVGCHRQWLISGAGQLSPPMPWWEKETAEGRCIYNSQSKDLYVFPLSRPLHHPRPQLWIRVWQAYWCHGFVCFIWTSRMTFWPSVCIVFFFLSLFHSPASSHCAGRGMRKSRPN